MSDPIALYTALNAFFAQKRNFSNKPNDELFDTLALAWAKAHVIEPPVEVAPTCTIEDEKRFSNKFSAFYGQQAENVSSGIITPLIDNPVIKNTQLDRVIDFYTNVHPSNYKLCLMASRSIHSRSQTLAESAAIKADELAEKLEASDPQMAKDIKKLRVWLAEKVKKQSDSNDELTQRLTEIRRCENKYKSLLKERAELKKRLTYMLNYRSLFDKRSL